MASRAEWKQRVAAWKRSGQTAEVFAAERGLNPRTLLWWSSTLRRPAARGAARAADVSFAQLVPVAAAPTVLARSAESATVELVLASGRIVRVRPGFDATLLRELVSALEEA
ncbi:IS66 family insertion sequence element accessory protein TnpB [Sorangium sp. So ce315]|uniref:IS66 family insertion sequence element accessory protein TnpA n=1 Tax=Sorangium sp. So ce315 TaxID=3133299 RepID=UPI003F5EEB30